MDTSPFISSLDTIRVEVVVQVRRPTKSEGAKSALRFRLVEKTTTTVLELLFGEISTYVRVTADPSYFRAVEVRQSLALCSGVSRRETHPSIAILHDAISKKLQDMLRDQHVQIPLMKFKSIGGEITSQLNGSHGEFTETDDVANITHKERNEAVYFVTKHISDLNLRVSNRQLEEMINAFVQGQRLKKGIVEARDWNPDEREGYINTARLMLGDSATAEAVTRRAKELFLMFMKNEFSEKVGFVDPENFYTHLTEDEDEYDSIDLTFPTAPPLSEAQNQEVSHPDLLAAQNSFEEHKEGHDGLLYAFRELDIPQPVPPKPNENPVGVNHRNVQVNKTVKKAIFKADIDDWTSSMLYPLNSETSFTTPKNAILRSGLETANARSLELTTLNAHNLIARRRPVLTRHVHPTYKIHIPVTKQYEDITSTEPPSISTCLLSEEGSVERTKPSMTKYSLVTDKYALNSEGLFRLCDGNWEQIIFKGGCGKTFRGLGIKPLEAAKVVGKYRLTDNTDFNLYEKSEVENVILNPIEKVENFVVSAELYRFFAKIRTSFENFFKPGVLYNGFTTLSRAIYVHRPLLEILRKKIGANTNDLIYNTIFALAFENCPCPQLALDTALYFFELKVILQSNAVATVEAHASFAKQRTLHRSPQSGISANPFKEQYDKSVEGCVVLSTRDEVRADFNKGVTTILKESYTACSTEYGSYDNPVREAGGMLEALNEEEELKWQQRGVSFKDPYIRFDYDESNVRDAWQSVGGGFATSVAVINHLSTRQAEMAHSRILFAREDETQQRYKASRFWDEARNVFESLCRAEDNGWCEQRDSAVGKLVRLIKTRDSKYEGGCRIYRTWEEKGGQHDDMPPPTLLQAFSQGCLHHTMSQINIAYTDHRVYDNAEALSSYIEEVGAKLPLRRALLAQVRERMLKNVQSRVNLVQCKPHEFQKYKIVNGQPCLKYARDVVSITGEDWLVAQPNLLAYVKKSLEGKHQMRFTYHDDNLFLNICYEYHDSEGNMQMLHNEYLVPLWQVERMHNEGYRAPDNVFNYQSVISDTSHEELAKVVNGITNAASNKPGDIYVITHGDDQVVVTHNLNAARYGGRMGTVLIEGDINDNDGSHVDQFYLLDYLTFVKRGEAPVEPFAQLANPLFLCNPNNVNQYAVLRRTHGMQMCSGSVHTTYGNSKMSMNVGMSLFFNPDMEYSKAAATVGMNVTASYGGLQDVTFLSKNFYRTEDGVRCYTDLASLLRKVGRVTGDVEGRSKTPIDIRFDDHNESVVKGWVHEPGSKILDIMRAKYITERPRYSKMFGKYIRTNPINLWGSASSVRSRPMNVVDMAIVRHYYPENPSKGMTDYQQLINMIAVNDTFGILIKSEFIDRIMNRRYGMTPVIH